MARWLLKTEPDTYSWDQLVKDKKTTWNGVSNPVALKHIRAMKKGDSVLIYHTGNQKAVIGVAEVLSAPYADPDEGDERLVVVDIKPRQKLKQPVTLSDIKADPAFAGWELLRIGRLSVVPVPDAMWKRIEELADSDRDQTSVHTAKGRNQS
jgi:predicted RNA-binding protein with PUA-like domain